MTNMDKTYFIIPERELRLLCTQENPRFFIKALGFFRGM